MGIIRFGRLAVTGLEADELSVQATQGLLETPAVGFWPGRDQ